MSASEAVNTRNAGSAADIRFTRNKANTVLYVTPLGWPGDGAVGGAQANAALKGAEILSAPAMAKMVGA